MVFVNQVVREIKKGLSLKIELNPLLYFYGNPRKRKALTLHRFPSDILYVHDKH
jgi:hypothetical protein